MKNTLRRKLLRAAAAMTAAAILPTIPASTARAAQAAEKATPPRVQLSSDSTLTQWKAADATDRSRVSVEIARKRLGPRPDRLELAKTAMEITGCVSRTSSDARFGSWKVEATAATCLSAPEKPAATAPAPAVSPLAQDSSAKPQ